jgi:hypothetical protein
VLREAYARIGKVAELVNFYKAMLQLDPADEFIRRCLGRLA